MTKCSICKEKDSVYDPFSRKISFQYTNEIKDKVDGPIISEIIEKSLYDEWYAENKDTDNFEYIRICPFVVCQNCWQSRFGFEHKYGFGPWKIDEPIIMGDTSLSSLRMTIPSLRLSEMNDNWNKIHKLPVKIMAILSQDIVIGTNVPYKIFNRLLEISKNVSAFGIEGRRIGTAFIVGGDTKNILENLTEQIVWNPFGYGTSERRNITNDDIKDSIIAFSQLDGVFIISNEGVVEAAGRRIKSNIEAKDETMPGKGTRHHSVKILTSITPAMGIVVSQSGPITIFKKRKLCRELKNINDYISPE